MIESASGCKTPVKREKIAENTRNAGKIHKSHQES